MAMQMKFVLVVLSSLVILAKSRPNVAIEPNAVTPPEEGNEVVENDPEEIMETANNIVFRPLFAYRKQTVNRRRITSSSSSSGSATSNANRRYSNNDRYSQQSYPYNYPSYGNPYYYPAYGNAYYSVPYYQSAEYAHVA